MSDREEVLTLHRYYIWMTLHRHRFEEVTAKATAEGRSLSPWRGSDEGIEAWAALSYWYASLYVVIEGWKRLRFEDEHVDGLLAVADNVQLLKRYRHGVFHYQPRYFDERFNALLRDGHEVVMWVRLLTITLGEAILKRLETTPEEDRA